MPIVMKSREVPPSTAHPFVYINGYPGVGKLTIARELQRILPNSKIYDNHLLIDPIAPLVDRTSPEYNIIRTNLRRHILDVIATSDSTRNITWIFTDSRCTEEAGSNAVKDYVDASVKRGAPFIPVLVTCDPEENLRRVVDEGRGKGGRTKLRDVGVLRSIRGQEDMYRFGNEFELELDVSNLSPQEAAQRIFDHIAKVMGDKSCPAHEDGFSIPYERDRKDLVVNTLSLTPTTSPESCYDLTQETSAQDAGLDHCFQTVLTAAIPDVCG